MYFRTKKGDLKEGIVGVRENLYELYREQNPTDKIEVRDCDTGLEEKMEVAELMDESVWSILGWRNVK